MAGNYRSGRKPKTDALRVLEGGKAKGPLPEAAMPAMPAYVGLDSLAVKYWDQIGAVLLRNRILTEDLGFALAVVAHQHASYERALEQLRDVRHRIAHAHMDGKRPDVKEMPFVRRAQSLSSDLMRMLGELGLTPVMAAKLAKPKQEGQSKWERLTQRRG